MLHGKKKDDKRYTYIYKDIKVNAVEIVFSTMVAEGHRVIRLDLFCVVKSNLTELSKYYCIVCLFLLFVTVKVKR